MSSTATSYCAFRALAMSKPIRFLGPYLFLLVLTPALSVQEQTFKRPDPLNAFKNYNGGYNVTNKHYFASAVFTGVHCYVIAGVWMSSGLAFGILVACKNLILKRDSSSSLKDFLNHHYLLMFLLFIIFAFLAIVASSVVLGANESSLQRIKKFKGTIVAIGKYTRRNIHKIIEGMVKMQYLLRPYEPATSLRLYTITHLLANEAQSIRDFVENSTNTIDLIIQTSHILHLVAVTINLILLVSSIVLLLLHWHPGFVTVICACWILTTICWALTGFDFFLQTFVDDSCTAFQEFEQDPQNSSLGSVLPCLDSSSSDQLLTEIGRTIHNFISMLNSKMEELYLLLPLDRKVMDLERVGRICDPFSGPPNYTYIPENCPRDSISIHDLPNILSKLTCHKEKSIEECTREGKFIPQYLSNMAVAYSCSVQNMISIYPDLESLTRCINVKASFSDVVKHQCKPFKYSVRLLWSSMLSLSIVMAISVLIWVTKAYQERGRHFSSCSIVPDV